MDKMILTFLLLACSFLTKGQDHELSGTIWLNSNIDNCTSKIEFLEENSLQHFYCGIGETNNGKYTTKGDTVIIEEYTVSDLPAQFGGTGESTLRFRYHFIKRLGTLVMIKYSDIEYNYEEIVDDPDFTYTIKRD